MTTATWHHLVGLAAAFTDPEHAASPDRDICAADQHPAEFERLNRGWRKCLHAASIIQSRYMADWSGGGPLAVIAEPVRDSAVRELTAVWVHLVDGYLSAVKP